MTFMVSRHKSNLGLDLCPSPWKPKVWFHPRLGPHPEHQTLGLCVDSMPVIFTQTTRGRWWGGVVRGVCPTRSDALFLRTLLTREVEGDTLLALLFCMKDRLAETIQKAWSGSASRSVLCLLR